MSFTETKIQRRKWTDEEKKSTLHSCNSRCARCGNKLTMKTLTMEHVVPISKGGENELNNLVVLCKSCNSRKADKFCWPGGYYMALDNTTKMRAIIKYTDEWVKNNFTIEQIQEYPIFTETLSMTMSPTSVTGKFVPQFVLDMKELNSESINRYLSELNITLKDVKDTVPNTDKLYSVFGVETYSNSRPISLYTIQLLNDTLVLSEVKSTSITASEALPLAILDNLARIYKHFECYIFNVRTQNIKTVNHLITRYRMHTMNTDVNGSYGQGEDVDLNLDKPWHDIECQFGFMTAYGIVERTLKHKED